MLTFKHEAPCVAALAFAAFASLATTMAADTDAQIGSITAAHDGAYFKCMRYSKKAAQVCRAETRRDNQSTRPCGILYRSYMQMCQAA